MGYWDRLIGVAVILFFCAGCTDHLQEGTDAYKERNYAAALKELQPLADKGDAVAQLYIGFMYDNGEGVPVDYRQAVVWYRKSAEQGNANAQYNLAMMHANGLYVPQDWVQALKWFNLAALSGDQEAAKAGKVAESNMAPEQVKEAWAMANKWKEEHQATSRK